MQTGGVSSGAGFAKMLGIFLLVIAASACAFGKPIDTGAIAAVNRLCPPGYYMGNGKEELPCHPCPEDSYKSGLNDLHGCIDHKLCSDLEVYILEGNSTANAVCQCRPGMQRVFPYALWDRRTYTCSPCPNGTVAMQVPDIPTSDPGDTICCKPEETPVVTEGERMCKRLGRDSLTGKENSTVQPSDDEYHDGPDLGYLLGGVFACIAAISTFLGIVIDYGRHHPDSWCGKIIPCCHARADQPEVAYEAAATQEIPVQ